MKKEKKRRKRRRGKKKEKRTSKISFYKQYIDTVPENFKNIETLFLSNNSISDLSGLEQFQQLKVLSIAYLKNICI